MLFPKRFFAVMPIHNVEKTRLGGKAQFNKPVWLRPLSRGTAAVKANNAAHGFHAPKLKLPAINISTGPKSDPAERTAAIWKRRHNRKKPMCNAARHVFACQARIAYTRSRFVRIESTP